MYIYNVHKMRIMRTFAHRQIPAGYITSHCSYDDHTQTNEVMYYIIYVHQLFSTAHRFSSYAHPTRFLDKGLIWPFTSIKLPKQEHTHKPIVIPFSHQIYITFQLNIYIFFLYFIWWAALQRRIWIICMRKGTRAAKHPLQIGDKHR